MTVTKITDKTAKTTPSGTEEIAINDGGTDNKMTLSNVVKLAFSTMTSSTIDLSGAAYTTVIDDDVADTLISDTSKPANPQYTKTITTLPTDTVDVQDYCVIITIGGQNTDGASARTINVIPTRNGTEVDTARSVSVTNGQNWRAAWCLGGAALVANDVIGVKMWSSVTNTNDYRYVTIYIVPRQFISTLNGMYILLVGGTVLTLSGAISGVTYVTNAPGLGLNGSGTIIDPVAGNILGPSGQITAYKGQNLSELGDTTTANKPTTDIGVTPNASAAVNLYKFQCARYIRKVVFS